MIDNKQKTNKGSRNIVINHPDGYSATVARSINRTTEADVDWNMLGNAYGLKVDRFNQSISMENHKNDEYTFLIEPEDEGSFEIKKLDLVHFIVGGIIRLAFEVVDIEMTNNLPLNAYRYICRRRNDLDLLYEE